MSTTAMTFLDASVITERERFSGFERVSTAAAESPARRRAEPLRRPSILPDLSPLRWRYGERLDDVIEAACRRFADRPAIALDGAAISFREFDARANQMARYLISRGVKPGDRVAVLLDRGLEAYVTLLALMKAGAAYVALDANHPADRVAYILRDSAARLAVAHLRLADRFGQSSQRLVILDTARDVIAGLDDSPLGDDERAPASDELCYVLYTSGTTGHPKGVAIEHRSICNFVRVAAEQYGFRPGDRVYQGMSMAFDFSVEELWVPLVAGATLVPNTAASSLFGEELADFLESRAVTCFCCVPTLLASIERELPKLRTLLIGGEACPQTLVRRWSRPGRVLLNSYGPTETTVTATLGRMRPDRAVTIGRPLPTYSVVILDPARNEALPMGEAGEIGIGGVGVARGYLNRQELTEAKFIPDFVGLPNNPSQRIYRTGDLGRIGADGEIEYLGRIDTQVKLRGYRIELTEIESVLMDAPEIAQCVVSTWTPAQGSTELVAYYALKRGAGAPDIPALVAHMRSRLPAYMIPAYLEKLPFIPTLVSNKPDRNGLPAPKSARLRLAANIVAPTTDTERLLCRAFAEVVGVAEASIDGDFFNEYGAHSLLMARFCAKVRACKPTMSVAMRDVYANPTVRRLARALDAAEPAASVAPEAIAAHRPTRLAYLACGVAQSFAYLVLFGLGFGFTQQSLAWTYQVVDSPLELFARALAVSLAWFFGHNALAIAAKWALVGRVKPQAIEIWSAAYFRWWLARLIVGAAPANAFAGAPLYNVYLRLLGARIGRHAVIATSNVPLVSADLFSVGDNATLTHTVVITGANAYGNRVHIDAVSIGAGAYVGEKSVLDIGSSIEDFGQLGHASSLQRGQRVPAGKRYHGSPAEETATNFRLAEEATCSTLRRALFTTGQLVTAFAGGAAAVVALLSLWGVVWARISPLVTVEGASASLPMIALASSFALYFGSVVFGLAVVFVAPRLANLFLKPGRNYRLYGFHYSMQGFISTISNNSFYNVLFGDSIFIERYLRFIGWKVGAGDVPGSNFGCEQGHANPFLVTIGEGTVSSDGLILGNYQMSNHAFRLSECRVGKHTFFGTDVYVPAGSRAGDNVMYGTKVMAPIDGPVRENCGLLGSPAFEIPRAANRDVELHNSLSKAERERLLSAKTRYNVRTIAMYMGSHWLQEFVAIYLLSLTAMAFGVMSFWPMALAALAVAALAAALDILLERAVLGFKRLEPETAVAYDQAFWRIERLWKFGGSATPKLFGGTPMRNVLSRLLGVKVGRMVFDDNSLITERSLVEIGDEANLNSDSILQAHSLEEGVFKSDRIRIGADCAIAPGAFVHYGVTMHEGSMLDADAYLMKGEIAPAHSRWRGNPARMMNARAAASRG